MSTGRKEIGGSIPAAVAVSEEHQQPQQLSQGDGGGGHIGQSGGGKGFPRSRPLFVGENSALLDGGQGTAAGVEFHGQCHQLEHQGQGKAGDAQIYEEIGELSQGGEKQPNEDQGHGQPGAKIGHRDDGGAKLDGSILLGVLHSVSGLVTGHTDGGGGGAAVYIVRQTNHIGAGVVVVGEVTADVLNPYSPHPIGGKNPGGGIRPGNPPGGMLLGVAAEGAVHMGAGPEGENQAGKNQIDIGPVKAVVVIWHGLLLSAGIFPQIR